MTDIKYMDLNEFVDDGWLQEANRLFFHPLGLAMELSDADQDHAYDTVRFWDYREDPEGIIYADGVIDEAKVETVHQERERHTEARLRLIGSIVQNPNAVSP